MTFVAHSFSTLLASYYAARYSEEVEQLVLLGTPVFEDEREAREHIREMSSMAGVFTLNPSFAREACKRSADTTARVGLQTENLSPKIAGWQDKRSESADEGAGIEGIFSGGAASSAQVSALHE